MIFQLQVVFWMQLLMNKMLGKWMKTNFFSQVLHRKQFPCSYLCVFSDVLRLQLFDDFCWASLFLLFSFSFLSFLSLFPSLLHLIWISGSKCASALRALDTAQLKTWTGRAPSTREAKWRRMRYGQAARQEKEDRHISPTTVNVKFGSLLSGQV